MIGLVKRRDMEGGGHGCVWCISQEWSRNTMEGLCQGSRSLGWDLNPERAEYKAEILPIASSVEWRVILNWILRHWSVTECLFRFEHVATIFFLNVWTVRCHSSPWDTSILYDKLKFYVHVNIHIPFTLWSPKSYFPCPNAACGHCSATWWQLMVW